MRKLLSAFSASSGLTMSDSYTINISTAFSLTAMCWTTQRHDYTMWRVDPIHWHCSAETPIFVRILLLKRLPDAIGRSAAPNYKTRLDFTAEATQEARRSSRRNSIKIQREAELTSLFHCRPKKKVY